MFWRRNPHKDIYLSIYPHTHTYTHTYIYIYIYEQIYTCVYVFASMLVCERCDEKEIRVEAQIIILTCILLPFLDKFVICLKGLIKLKLYKIR